jgi:apolipoprotein N-acyltransferase
VRAVGLAILGTVVSAVLFAWALPPTSLWPLGWIAFAPMLAAIRGRGFLVGFICGIATLMLTALVVREGWLPGLAKVDGESAWLYSGCGFFGFVVSILSGIAGEWKTSGPWRIVAFAAVGVVLEACLLWVLPAHIALTQWRVPAMMSVASVTGIWGVSALLWASNLLIAQAVQEKRPRLALLTVIATAWCGLSVILKPPLAQSETDPLFVAVQSAANQPEDMMKWQRDAAKRPAANLSVWPEFAGMMAAPRGDTTELREISKFGPPFVTSFPDDASPLPHNTASVFANGEESARYFKRKPFGGEKNMHAAGDRAVAVPLPSDLGGRVALAICYDSCYPSVMREAARIEGVKLIALPTIDPESPQAFIAAVHASFTTFRAAELGVPIIRADGYAYSAVVNATGAVRGLQPPGEATLRSRMPLEARWTVYKALGDWMLPLSGAIVLVGIVVNVRRKDRALDESDRLEELVRSTLADATGREETREEAPL